MTNPIITLSTKDGYPFTYISSKVFNIAGVDGFISVDFSDKSYNLTPGVPTVSLIGVMLSATPQAVKEKLNLGDKVIIGRTEYTLVNKSTRKVFGNGDLVLEPTE